MLWGRAYFLYQRMTSSEVLEVVSSSAVRSRDEWVMKHLCDVCGRSLNFSLLSGPVRKSGEDMFRMQLVEHGD